MHCWFLLRFLVPNIFVLAIFSQLPPLGASRHLHSINTYFFREWTCDNCIRDVVLISTQYSLPEITHGLEYWLMHEAYCEDPALGLNENQIEHCQDGIKGFLGPAFRALDAAYVAQAQSICHYWYDGICPRPHY